MCRSVFFFQAEDGIRDLVRSRGLGDVYKRQEYVSNIAIIGGTGALGGALAQRLAASGATVIVGSVSYTPLTLPPSDLG